jgi:tetratricopeptide (TPR) repeat protein
MSEVLSLEAMLEGAAEAYQQRRLPEAEEILRIVIAETPGRADALAMLGTIRAQSGDADEGIDCLRRACELAPHIAGYHNNLALALTGADQIDAAVESYRTALAIDPGSVFILVNLGRLLRRISRLSEAVECFTRALALHPESPEMRTYLADTLALAGDDVAAEVLYRQVVGALPDLAVVWYALALVHRFESEDDPDLDTMCRVMERTGLQTAEQCPLSFGIAKAYDDLRLYDLAFAYFDRGNALHRELETFDIEVDLAQMAEVIDIFDADLIERKKCFGNRTRKPVFIVGMPRAGKTLLETQLACYRGMFAGGESAFIRVPRDPDTTLDVWQYPRYMPSLSGERIEQTAAALLASIDRAAPDASRFINTMPGNFVTAGLIRILFPEATIIHCVRDPRDTCLSNYFKLFMKGWLFTYDLALLGRYYVAYQRLMRHWHSVMSGIVEVRYEDLIANPEHTVREVAQVCGLQESDRLAPLPTLHSAETGRWRHYAAHLAPLINALREGGDHAGLTNS